MMDAGTILRYLQDVDAERERRASSVELLERVHALKAYQQRRFSHTYADLLAAPRYRAAALFFLHDLYGPQDFASRDAQFARVVPALVRLFPQDIVATVATLAELHALSEQLDSAMAFKLESSRVNADAYVRAWLATGRADARQRQIDLTLTVGEALDRLTRNPLLRHSLRLMRNPARAAGLYALQQFLERGFDVFKEMRGSQQFLLIIGERERALAQALFSALPTERGEVNTSILEMLPQ